MAMYEQYKVSSVCVCVCERERILLWLWLCFPPFYCRYQLLVLRVYSDMVFLNNRGGNQLCWAWSYTRIQFHSAPCECFQHPARP